ncbi:MAG: putative transposase [Cyclobacteriaceae bacterium]
MIGSTLNTRNEADISAPLGIATTRYEDRMATAVLGAGNATIEFDAHEAVCGAGILFLLPALLAQGLLKTKDVYTVPESHYYGLESVVLTLAFMALARIKNPEQLKQCKPGEIGKIIGLDRIPEVRCLRDKIKLLTHQEQAQKLNRLLIDHWYSEPSEEASFLYIDGHVRIYYGHKANLPAKFVSRQKLCLSATTEYWVNDAKGLPVIMVTGELTEKLQKVIEHTIIAELQKTVLLPTPVLPVKEEEVPTVEVPVLSADIQSAVTEEAEATKELPVCTLIFDREAYQPAFFERLWKQHRIAVITYRKNVKDTWDKESFKNADVKVLEHTITMQLCERQTTLGGVLFREIRRLTDKGHQTAIITTNQIISMEVVAGRMFGRWSQENFFRYMIMDYDFDKMIQFGTEAIDENKEVVNPPYRQMSHRLKKEKEKTGRLKAKVILLTEQALEASLDEMPALQNKQIALMEQIEKQQETENKINEQRKTIPPRIMLKDMPEQTRYNKLKQESKTLMNIIKMICYRAETATANELGAYLKETSEEKRMLVKQIIKNNADLYPDYRNKTLTITLHSLSAPRFNQAAEKLTLLLNQTETVFPGTELKLIYKISALSHCER